MAGLFRKRKLPKPRKGAWFIPLHWSYLPASRNGWLTYIPFVAFLIGTFVYFYMASFSVVSTLFSIIPYWVAAAVIMHWIAGHKS